MVEFTIPGKPQGKARARTFYNPRRGKMQSITPDNTVLYENLIKQCYIATGGCLYEGALRIEISAYFSIPKTCTKKLLASIQNGETKPTKKPDADNIAKVVCDALNGLAYRDDTQIVEMLVHKQYDIEPRVVVVLSTDKEGWC